MAGGQTAPLLEVAEAPFDDVAVAVVGGVDSRWASAAIAAADAVPRLVRRFSDHRDDAPLAQTGADRAGRVGLVPRTASGRVRASDHRVD